MDNMEYESFLEMISARFIRGFIAGFIGSMAMLMSSASSLTADQVITNYKAWIFAAIAGGISGGALAVDKWIRSDGTDYVSPPPTKL